MLVTLSRGRGLGGEGCLLDETITKRADRPTGAQFSDHPRLCRVDVSARVR
jgi:hypothetical protein